MKMKMCKWICAWRNGPSVVSENRITQLNAKLCAIKKLLLFFSESLIVAIKSLKVISRLKFGSVGKWQISRV